MPPVLVNIPPREFRRIVDAQRIDSGYTKGYTEPEMRGWAADLADLQRLSPDELQLIRATPRDELDDRGRRLHDCDRQFRSDPTKSLCR